MSFQPPYLLHDEGRVSFIIPMKQLTPGRYFITVSLGVHQGHLIDKVENIASFEVDPADIYGTGYFLTAEDGVCSLFFKATANE